MWNTDTHNRLCKYFLIPNKGNSKLCNVTNLYKMQLGKEVVACVEWW